MPAKKPSHKKSMSAKKREEIREAVDSIPSLIIEHVSFQNDMRNSSSNDDAKKKYILSHEKRHEHQKKQWTVFLGVGVVVVTLVSLWILNTKTFFIDAKHTTSSEERLLQAVRENFNATVGSITPSLTPTSTLASTPEPATTTTSSAEMENLKNALNALLTSTSSSSSILTATSSTSSVQNETASSTTSTP